MSASGAHHLAASCCERPVFFTPGTAGDLSPKVFCVYVLFCFWILVQQIWPPVFKASQTDETQPPCCRLSQTGLCCHGNMLWRSSYWDSAGWQVTVLAVRVFGPLSLPQTSCPLWEPAPRSSLQSNRGLPLSRLECTLCLCIGLCVFVCSKKKWTFSPSASDVPRICFNFVLCASSEAFHPFLCIVILLHRIHFFHILYEFSWIYSRHMLSGN